jgi:cell division protein FtsB
VKAKTMKADPIYIPKSPVASRVGKYTVWQLSGKTMGIVLLLLLVGSLIGSFYLNQASQTTAAGLEIVRLTREREKWRQENADLRRRIAEMESLSRIEERAAELGLVKAESVEYLVVENLPAEDTGAETTPSSLTPPPDQAEVSPSEASDWWGELADQFASWINPQQ